jgi:hypothetical protein
MTAREKVTQEPCRCVRCGACRGKRTMRVYDRSQAEGYDLERCEDCSGSGIAGNMRPLFST